MKSTYAAFFVCIALALTHQQFQVDAQQQFGANAGVPAGGAPAAQRSQAQLMINSPVDKSFFSAGNELEIKLEVANFNIPQDGKALVIVNGQEAAAWTQPSPTIGMAIPSVPVGTYRILVLMVDHQNASLGINASATVHFVDQQDTRPKAYIHTPANDEYFYGTEIMVKGSVKNFNMPTDGVAALYVDEQPPVTIESADFAIPVSGLTASYHNASVVLWDRNSQMVGEPTQVKFLIGQSEISFGHVASQTYEMAHLAARRQDFFVGIFRKNTWGSEETVSGHGSHMAATVDFRNYLSEFIKRENIKTLLDMPCGDMHWMRHVDLSPLTEFVGADIVPELIDANRKLYVGQPKFRFMVWDAVLTPLDRAYDLVVVRDLVFHLPQWEVKQILTHLSRSGTKYIMISHNPYQIQNHLSEGVPWNLLEPPFSLPKPLESLPEDGAGETYPLAKYTDLWALPLPGY